jgi:anti-anti-sigma factor
VLAVATNSRPLFGAPVTPGDEPTEAFSLSLDMAGPIAIITLRGQIDESAATDLASVLDQVLANGYPSTVLDLVALDSLADPAMALIADAARRLTVDGRQLSIRSPSTPIHRLLMAEGLGELIRGGEFSPTAPAVSALPTDDDLIDATLRLVIELARATVIGADGVSVSLLRHGRLATVAASDQTVLDMDAHQYATGEGPCIDASTQGRWFHAPSLDTEDRWPAFTPRAMALGIRAILSSPLVAWGLPVGALNIYSHQPTAFATGDQRLAMKFATEASALLADAGVDSTDDQRSERFQASLRSREVIAQAQGVLMERHGFSEEEAFTSLRLHSQRTGLSLRARAEEITGSTRPPPQQSRPVGDGDDDG